MRSKALTPTSRTCRIGILFKRYSIRNERRRIEVTERHSTCTFVRMKFTGIDVFDSTIQRTNSWLKELMIELNSSDHRKTYLVLRSVLHALRDHLSDEDAIYLGEQLPMLIRGLYFEGWDPHGKPLPLRNQNDFLAVLSLYMASAEDSTSNAESASQAVFRLLDRKMTEGEIEDIEAIIPPVLSDLWPPTLRAA